MKNPVQRIGMLVGFLWASLTEDSPPRAAAGGTTSADSGNYHTAPLNTYRPEDCDLAERIFQAVSARLTSGKAHRLKGSYSFTANSSPGARAKIVIVQRGVGRVSQNFPIHRTGVYILLRTRGSTRQPTIGVAPNYAERFTYRRVAEGDVDAAVQEVVTAVEQAAGAAAAP